MVPVMEIGSKSARPASPCNRPQSQMTTIRGAGEIDESVATTKGSTMSDIPETCSGGGPVLAIPAEHAAGWSGTDGGDYDRACSSQDYRSLDYGAVGWVQVGEGRALALDMELVTGFLATDSGGVILRNYEECPLSCEAAGAMVSGATNWESWGAPMTLTDGRLFLFDSAYPGAADPAAIEADEGVAIAQLGPGTYAIDTALADGVELIRFTRST